jgi:hypothetical protein
MRSVKRDWESEFWHYVSTGDGTQCPVYTNCPLKDQDPSRCTCGLYNIAVESHERDEVCSLCSEVNYCFNEEDGGSLCNNSNLGFLEKLRPGRIFELLQMLSESWLRIGDVHETPVPVDLIHIMDRECPVEVRTIPLKAYGGAIWKTSDGWIIYLNANDCVPRQRLTLFHEAFHLLAHSKTTPIFKKRGSDKGSFNELLADNFALHILMPRKWIEKSWWTCNDVSAVAEQFQVTENAALSRLKSLNLL